MRLLVNRGNARPRVVDKSRVQMQEPRPSTVAKWRPGGASKLE